MFSGNFAKGFITGLAESVDREIQKDMAETSENIRRISDIQVERGILDAKEAKAKEKELTKEMKKMQGELEGSADAVQYLIDRFGYEKAKSHQTFDHSRRRFTTRALIRPRCSDQGATRSGFRSGWGGLLHRTSVRPHRLSCFFS